MYLEFISDIANVGDLIKITTGKQVIEGEIIKISSSLIAVKNNNGSVVLCKDEDILDLQVNPENKNTPPKNTIVYLNICFPMSTILLIIISASFFIAYYPDG